MNMPKVYLKKNEDRRIRGGHLWIYSNEIDTKKSALSDFTPGQLVQFHTHTDQLLGTGYVNPKVLLAGRLLSSQPNEFIDENFLRLRIQQALNLRENFFAKPFYRLIYGEGDFLPGLIVDRYDDVLVTQLNTAGMEKLQPLVILALQHVLNPACILLRNDSPMRLIEGLPKMVEVVYGKPPEVLTIKENDCLFNAPFQAGQKTGWFYDHRINRQKLKDYVSGKKVCDAFSYIGGWGIQAAYNGATSVSCIDSSEEALTWLKKNAELNSVATKIHSIAGNVFDVFKKFGAEQNKFDVIILDPPALIKKRKDIKEGVIAYQRLNELALQLLNNQGFLISCSCSLHMSFDMLIDIIRRCGVKLKKQIKIIHVGFQGPDHPMHPAIQETTYLKAIFCYVENK